MVKRKKIEYITVEEMNKHLKYVRDNRKLVFRGQKDGELVNWNAFIEDGTIRFRLTYRRGSRACTYICRKDGIDDNLLTNGLIAYSTLQQYHNIKDFRDDKLVKSKLGYSPEEDKFLVGGKTLLYNNSDYEKKVNNAVSYDVNSSYPWAMCQPMPNTDVHYREGEVKPSEVGFRVDKDGYLTPVFKGRSSFIFPLIESPYKRFIDVWYGRKKNAKCKEDKTKAKQIMNFAVGYLQKRNPFIRCMILYWSNKNITDLMDENTIYCNTDCIVSLIPRDDIPVGNELGQFKQEHEGIFKYLGFNYQWNLETPKVRGKDSAWFKPGFDILKDTLPDEGNTYEFDYMKKILVKIKEVH